MLISREKLDDMKFRESLLWLMDFSLRNGHLEQAKEFGKLSKEYGDRIKGDYTERDKRRARIDSLLIYPLNRVINQKP